MFRYITLSTLGREASFTPPLLLDPGHMQKRKDFIFCVMYSLFNNLNMNYLSVVSGEESSTIESVAGWHVSLSPSIIMQVPHPASQNRPIEREACSYRKFILTIFSILTVRSNTSYLIQSAISNVTIFL